MKKLYVSKSTESTRLFKNGFLESLSKVHFSVPLFVFIPIIVYFYYLGFKSPDVSLASGLLYSLFGVLVWTVVEYVMHRWVFHFHPNSEMGKKIHFIFHGIHHDFPQDRLRLVLPPSVSLPLATGFYFLFKMIFTTGFFYPFFATFLLGYLVYDMFHYAIHHVHIKGKLWNVLKTHHLKHHYVDPDKGFGVSSPLWDVIVQSGFSNEGVEVEKKK